MKIIATIEARMSSTRLPGKVLRQIAGKPMLQWLIERIKPSQTIDEIVVATSVESSDDAIVELAKGMNVSCCRGSLEDVLGRLTRCAESKNADLIVKLAGDNPLYHYELIDSMIELFQNSNYDFLGTTFMGYSKAWNVPRTFPLGLGVAIFPLWVLQDADRSTQNPDDRESIVKYIIDRPGKFRLGAFQAEGRFSRLNRPELRLTVDTQKDFELMEYIFSSLPNKNELFSIEEVIEFLDEHPQIRDSNKDINQKGLLK
jgi:spore coat polysaccharide biosynthesis protein SpsF (cytidylyltransferase family)